MKKPVKDMTVAELRENGYAVVLFSPEALCCVEPSTLQNRLVELGNEAIADLGETLLIYSPSEAALSGDGAGFWNNDDGWTTLEGATRFEPSEMLTVSLPVATGGDVRWVREYDMDFSRAIEGPGV